MKRIAYLIAAAVALPAVPVFAQTNVTPQNFQLPAGGDCSAELTRYRAIQSNDIAMGHVAKSVSNQIKRELEVAEKTCSAGEDAKAKAMIRASKVRHGYPTDL